jgi:V8-like Glu-specific endopeptidase
VTTPMVTHRLQTGAPPSAHHVGMPFDPDNRERIGQTIQAPWSAVGLVSAHFPTAGYIAESTGFVIGDRYVVTAAHAVYDKANGGGVASKVIYQPARNASQLPFRTSTVSTWKYPTEYPAAGRLYDYCLLTLAEPLPREVLHYRLTVASDSELTSGEFQIAGYPDDVGKRKAAQCRRTHPALQDLHVRRSKRCGGRHLHRHEYDERGRHPRRRRTGERRQRSNTADQGSC